VSFFLVTCNSLGHIRPETIQLVTTLTRGVPRTLPWQSKCCAGARAARRKADGGTFSPPNNPLLQTSIATLGWLSIYCARRAKRRDRVWKPAKTSATKAAGPAHGLRLFCSRCFFRRLGREGASPAGFSSRGFPVFQLVRAAATVWKRVRRLWQIKKSLWRPAHA